MENLSIIMGASLYLLIGCILGLYAYADAKSKLFGLTTVFLYPIYLVVVVVALFVLGITHIVVRLEVIIVINFLRKLFRIEDEEENGQIRKICNDTKRLFSLVIKQSVVTNLVFLKK